MRRQLLLDVVRSLAAAFTLIALVIGLPVALAITRGWPLPSSAPSLDAVGDALGGATISDSVLLDGLACLTWLVWAVLGGCVLVELVAWVRGRAAGHVPGAGALQLVARRLVVSATLLLSASRIGAGPSLPVTTTPIVAVIPPSIEQSNAPATPAAEAPQLPTCTVQPRDSLWRIAERHLGDPFRWREIYELNNGRSFPDGRVLRDPDLIHPGWELNLPRDAIGVAPPVMPMVAPSIVPTTQPELLPAVSTTTIVAAPAHADDLQEVDLADADDESDETFPVPPRLAGATLVLAGAVASLVGLRRRQRRLRERGRAIRLPGASALRGERTMRAVADVETADRLDLALRALTSHAVDAPPIDAVRVHDGEVEILFREPAMGEDDLFSGTGTRAWTLPASTPTAAMTHHADAGCVAPALVCVGQADAGDVLIDLEAGGPLFVHGEETDVTATLWSLVIDLATHRWADDVRVVVCGLDERGLTALDRIEVEPDLDALLEDVERESEARQAAIQSLGLSSTWSARLASQGDGWAPTIVVLGPGLSEPQLIEVADRLTDCSGVALVIASPPDAPADGQRRLLVSTGREHVALLPLDIVLRPAALPDDVLFALDDLISTAAGAEPGEPLYISGDAPSEVIDLREPAYERPPTGVLVRIMGRVEIEGGKTKIDRRRVIEFVTLLALHPRGLTEGQIKAALWTDQEPTTNAFNQVVSRARVALGIDSSGQPHVRYVEGCVYKPGPELTTDWSLLEGAWMAASRSPSSEVVAVLARLLDEVRGLPFEGTKGYEWAYELGLPSRIEGVIDEAETLLADRSAIATA